MNESELANEPPVSSPVDAGDETSPAGGQALSHEGVLEALRNVYDPELGINIVDLGLVYEVRVEGPRVEITYSLTTMGCPIGPLIEQQMQQFVSAIPGVEEVSAEMVLRPPWNPEMMSDEAKAALGVF
jgi:metal-sulfur cluster biosynthetic enzyme